MITNVTRIRVPAGGMSALSAFSMRASRRRPSTVGLIQAFERRGFAEVVLHIAIGLAGDTHSASTPGFHVDIGGTPDRRASFHQKGARPTSRTMHFSERALSSSVFVTQTRWS